MSFADIPAGEPSRRLDSWKEIAEYLRREVRTAARWESQGLPVHRVPGGKGRSVYALTGEIDAWLAGHSTDPEITGEVSVPEVAASPRKSSKYFFISAAFGLAVIAIGATTVWSRVTPPIDFATAHVTATNLDVTITDGSGSPHIVYRFDPADRPVPALHEQTLLSDVDADGTPEILTATGYYVADRDRAVRSGELLNLAASGGVRWRFPFDYALTFKDRAFSGPWVLTDWQVQPGPSPARIAVSAHDFTWWAAAVAMLDQHGQRLGTFINPGWIESLHWLDRSRLAIAGFNNARDEAMMAVLKSDDIDGQAPGSEGTAFVCPTCPSATPLFYATFVRSELNRMTAGRFNRAEVTATADQILVTTSETTHERTEGTAIYEFDRDLRFVRARYSEQYWDEHRRLELEGRITHSRDTCPEREGPPAIHIWDASRGWIKTLPITKPGK